jgi:hypothetical protein
MNMQCVLLFSLDEHLDSTLIGTFSLQMFCNALRRFEMNVTYWAYIVSVLMMDVIYCVHIVNILVMDVIYCIHICNVLVMNVTTFVSLMFSWWMLYTAFIFLLFSYRMLHTYCAWTATLSWWMCDAALNYRVIAVFALYCTWIVIFLWRMFYIAFKLLYYFDSCSVRHLDCCFYHDGHCISHSDCYANVMDVLHYTSRML